MTIIDPWERAAQCERALLDISDSTRRRILTDLHALWVSLAEEGCWHSPEWDRELEKIDRLQADLMRPLKGCLAKPLDGG